MLRLAAKRGMGAKIRCGEFMRTRKPHYSIQTADRWTPLNLLNPLVSCKGHANGASFGEPHPGSAAAAQRFWRGGVVLNRNPRRILHAHPVPSGRRRTCCPECRCAAPAFAGPEPPAGLDRGLRDGERHPPALLADGRRGKPALVMAHGSSDDGLCWTNLAKEFQDALRHHHVRRARARVVRSADRRGSARCAGGGSRRADQGVEARKADPDGTLDGQRFRCAFRGEVSGRAARGHPRGSRARAAGDAARAAAAPARRTPPHSEERQANLAGPQQPDRSGARRRLHEELAEVGPGGMRNLGAIEAPPSSRPPSASNNAARPPMRELLREDHGADVDSESRRAR